MSALKAGSRKPLIITKRMEEILRTIHFYRFMSAQDVAYRLYSPKSLTHVREILSSLAGGEDFKTNQYLYRFKLANISSASGNIERIYTLGSKGRDYLEKVVGLSVAWYFRPYKLKHFSYGQVAHSLVLTRALIAGHVWAAQHPDLNLAKTQICYELAKSPASVQFTHLGKTEAFKVIPDAWLLFEQTKGGEHEHGFPVLLEIDRGMESREKFKRHVRSRLEFIKKGGAYSKLFGTDAAMIAYMTTGDRPEYRETRRKAMLAWTKEVLAELHKESWASSFRFHSLCLADFYKSDIFDEPVWYRPDSPTPVPLFAP
jgi:hypothetical protein